MARFRIVDPRGEVVASKNFDSAEAAHAWFTDATAGSTDLGWRMDVEDDGKWALFDDTGGFTAQASRRPLRR
jgi:hypothetical protein